MSALGILVAIGGWGAVIVGVSTDDDNVRDKALIGGLAAIALGEVFKSGSAADLRCFDVLPRVVYIVPLHLTPGANTIGLRLGAGEGSQAVRHYIMPGEKTPAVYTVRMDDAISSAWTMGEHPGEKEWREIKDAFPAVAHPNDVTGPVVGTYPYILGGTCVCRPSQEVLDAYQAGGYLLDYSVERLRDLYMAEGIVEAPLPPGPTTGASYRHVLDGGLLLATPIPGSATFERLTFSAGSAYVPRSKEVREATEEIAHAKSVVAGQ